LTRAATFIALLIAALIFPAIWGGAGEAQDGAPPRLLEWPMLTGESLNQLAGLIYPGDATMQHRFITAAVRENPATFSKISPSHKFESETLIWLPDLKALSRYGANAKSPHRFMRPTLPAMQPHASGAKPSPLQMSVEIENKPTPKAESKTVAEGVALKAAPDIQHMNAVPVDDKESMAAFNALIERNESLKKVQSELEVRIAALESAIEQVKNALMGEAYQPTQRVRRVTATVEPIPPREDSLLSPSPLHLLTAAGVLLIGVGVVLLRRRLGGSRGGGAVVAVPVASKKAISDFGEPTGPSIHIEENFVNDGLISVDEIESIVEEAKVFVALGRTEYAIEVLEDYITTHPRASAHPWLYLMDIHRSTQNRAAFEAVAKRFHQAMNVVIPQWDNGSQMAMVVAHSLEEFPHITARLVEGWTKRDAQDFLNHLLQDNRGGERQGFSMEVLQDILLLLAVIELRDHLPVLEPF
jgi:uncharacterized small protein (DUF1192 family)